VEFTKDVPSCNAIYYLLATNNFFDQL